jgi:hypothetical protein
MIMDTKTKIYLLLAGVLVVMFAIASAWSGIQRARLEKAVGQAEQTAKISEAAALESERNAAEYKAKIELLENNLNEIRLAARRQDEELEKITADITSARGRVERARAVRAISTSAAELCKKLETLGHPCE